MSRILLVDDSSHAQRIGERILTGEGFEVVTVSNADAALVRIEDVDPDVVIADTVMPGRTGYDICQYLKMSPRHRHVRVILTSGVLEPVDEAQAQRAQADGSLKKPFEATALINAVRQLAEESAKERKQSAGGQSAPAVAAPPSAPFVAVVDAEQVRAAVTVALDASMDAMADEISRRVMVALQTQKSLAKAVE
jgi:CheY-like chemotaxis protein